MYDKLGFNRQILLDLRFREQLNAITHSIAKPFREITRTDTAPPAQPTWATLVAGTNVLEFDGNSNFCECANADTLDLDFLAGDYSLSIWVNITDTGSSEVIFGRYELNVSGWELYYFNNAGIHIMTIRHHHAGTIVDGQRRSAGSSIGWTPGNWFHLTVTRVGNTVTMYRDGVALTTTMSTGGVVSPETCAQDLVLGIRFTKDSDFFQGQQDKVRIWPRALTAQEIMIMYELEKGGYP